MVEYKIDSNKILITSKQGVNINNEKNQNL